MKKMKKMKTRAQASFELKTPMKKRTNEKKKKNAPSPSLLTRSRVGRRLQLQPAPPALMVKVVRHPLNLQRDGGGRDGPRARVGGDFIQEPRAQDGLLRRARDFARKVDLHHAQARAAEEA